MRAVPWVLRPLACPACPCRPPPPSDSSAPKSDSQPPACLLEPFSSKIILFSSSGNKCCLSGPFICFGFLINLSLFMWLIINQQTWPCGEVIQGAGRLLTWERGPDSVMLWMACAHVCKRMTRCSSLSPSQVRPSGLSRAGGGVRADGILSLCSPQSLISELVKLLFEHRNEVLLLSSVEPIGLFQVVLVVKDQPANAGGIG